MSEHKGKVEWNGTWASWHESGRQRFPEEFKRDAVRLVAEEGYTFKAAAQAVGAGVVSLRQWHARLAPSDPANR